MVKEYHERGSGKKATAFPVPFVEEPQVAAGTQPRGEQTVAHYPLLSVMNATELEIHFVKPSVGVLGKEAQVFMVTEPVRKLMKSVIAVVDALVEDWRKEAVEGRQTQPPALRLKQLTNDLLDSLGIRALPDDPEQLREWLEMWRKIKS